MASIWGQVPGVGLAESIQDTQLAARYADRVGMLAIDSLGESGAIRALDNRLATIAITENSVAFNEQRRAIAWHLADRFDLDEVWDAQLDQATCQECWSLNNEVAAVGGQFPGNARPGMVHARCRCTSHLIRRTYH